MNNDLPVNVSYEYKFEKQNIERAREEWNRNKNKLGQGFYAYHENTFVGDVDDEDAAAIRRNSHRSLLDQEAMTPYSSDKSDEAAIRAQAFPKTTKGWNAREDRLNAKFVQRTQQEYLDMRERTKRDGELLSNDGKLFDNDGEQRKRTLKEQQQLIAMKESTSSSSSSSSSASTSSSVFNHCTISIPTAISTPSRTLPINTQATSALPHGSVFFTMNSTTEISASTQCNGILSPDNTATTQSATTPSTTSAFHPFTPSELLLLENSTSLTPPSSTLLNSTPLLPMDYTSSTSPSTKSPPTERLSAYRINIFTKPYQFELKDRCSFFSSGKEAKIDYSKKLKEAKPPAHGEISLNRDISNQLEGLDEDGCLAISFLPCSSKTEQRVGFMTGLDLKADWTSTTYGIIMRPRWGVTADEYVPKLPLDVGFTTKALANFKTLLVTRNIFGWLKDEYSGELCIHCSKDEAIAFIEEIKGRLAQLTPTKQGGIVDAELVVQPPLEENVPPHIWIKLPGLILRQLGLIIYVYASRHVFVVDNKDRLLVLGKMPFTKNLQPEDPISSTTTTHRGTKRKRK